MNPPQPPREGTSTTRRCLLVLAVIYLLWVGINVIWVGRNKLSTGCDVYTHLELALRFHDRLARMAHDPTLKLARKLLTPDGLSPVKWPRFTYLATAPGTALFGRSPTTSILFAGSLFTLVLLLSLFFLGRALYGPAVGLLGAALAALFPALAAFSRTYGLDYPLAAMVTLSLAVLVNTRGFQRRGLSLLLAPVLALTLLTKLQGALFLLFPLGLEAAAVLRAARRRDGPLLEDPALRNLLWFGGLMLAISLVLFLPAVPTVLNLVHAHRGAAGRLVSSNPDSLTLLSNWLFYPLNVVFAVSPPLFLAVLAGLVLRRRSFWLMGTLLVPMVLLTLLFSTRWARFYLPALPLLALAGAGALLEPSRRLLRLAACCATLLVGLGLLLSGSFGARGDRFNAWAWKRNLPVSVTALRPPQRDDLPGRVAPVVSALVARHPPGSTLVVGIVDQFRLGFGFGKGVRLLLHAGLPDRKVIVFGSGQDPVPFFARKTRLDYLVVLTRRRRLAGKPRLTLQEIFRQYQLLKTLDGRWPYFHYNYLSKASRLRAAELAAWPRILDTTLDEGRVLLELFQRPDAPAPPQ